MNWYLIKRIFSDPPDPGGRIQRLLVPQTDREPSPPHVATALVGILLTGLGSFPLAMTVWAIIYQARAALFLGHWPTYNYPDPKTLPLDIQQQGSLIGTFITLALWLAFMLLHGWAMFRLRSDELRIGFGAAWMLVLMTLCWGFGALSGCWEWYLD